MMKRSVRIALKPSEAYDEDLLERRLGFGRHALGLGWMRRMGWTDLTAE